MTEGYDGARQETLEDTTKIEPVSVKLWDMRVRASARIMQNGVQDNLIEEKKKHKGSGTDGASLTWAAVKGRQFNTSLEEILTSMGDNGEWQIR